MNIHAKGTRRKYSKRISIEKAQTKTVATTTIILATERTAGNEKHRIFLVERRNKNQIRNGTIREYCDYTQTQKRLSRDSEILANLCTDTTTHKWYQRDNKSQHTGKALLSEQLFVGEISMRRKRNNLN